MDEYNLYLIKKSDSIRSKTKFCDEKGSQFLFADNLSLVIRFSKKKKKKYRQLLCTKIQSQKPIRIPSSKINFVSRCIHFTNKKPKKKKKKKSTQSPIYCITKISSRSISKTNKIHGRKLESIPRGAHERIYLLSLDAPCDVITAIK